MPFRKLSPHIQQRVQALEHVFKTSLRAGHEALAWAYRNAAMALRRGDEITTELWLEKADIEAHVLKVRA